MDIKEARRLGKKLEKSLNKDLKKDLKESWRYFKTLADDPNTPENIRYYILSHYKFMKTNDFEDKAPAYLVIDTLAVHDMIEVYDNYNKKINEHNKQDEEGGYRNGNRI